MPVLTSLPKGCTTAKGATNIVHPTSRGEGLSQQANRLYMLTVRRESLLNKKQTLETQLKGLTTQLKNVETEIFAIEKRYGKIIRKNSGRRMKFKTDDHAVKKVSLKY